MIHLTTYKLFEQLTPGLDDILHMLDKWSNEQRWSYIEGDCASFAATVSSLNKEMEVYVFVNTEDNSVIHYILKYKNIYFDANGKINDPDFYIRKVFGYPSAELQHADKKTGITTSNAKLNGDHEQFYNINNRLKNEILNENEEAVAVKSSGKMPKFSEEFKKEFNDWIIEFAYGKNRGNFHQYWALSEKYPQYLLDEDEREFVHDKILASHHNTGSIHKRVNERQKFNTIVESFDDIARLLLDTYKYKTKDFFDWYENYDLKIFRGKPTDFFHKFTDKPKDLESGEMKPFSLDRNMSIRFTQSGFYRGAWKDEKARNGWLIEATINPKDMQYFNNSGYELEVIAKGPLKYDKIQKVISNKVKDI